MIYMFVRSPFLARPEIPKYAGCNAQCQVDSTLTNSADKLYEIDR